MTYTPVTPFRRAVEAAHLEHQKQADAPLPPQGVNKYEALRELAAARVAFGLTDRDIGVLQALVSFQPGAILGGNSDDLVVHPSNAAICERLNGMPCSTMRRHLGHLVAAGVILRRDSPNGKRYARRYGDEKVAFGFDLRPLVQRFEEFCAAAETVRAAAEAHKRLRETVSLMRRDLLGLVTYGLETRPDLTLWDQLSDLCALAARDLRRKLSTEDMEQLQGRILGGLNAARDVFELGETKNMSINDAKNEQHIQNSNTDSYDLELCSEKQNEVGESEPRERHLPNVPLGLVLSVCGELHNYSSTQIRHWHEFVGVVETLRPMMGISPSAWEEAKHAMGPEEAAVVLAAMLERFSEIKSPGGYLRHLTAKSEAGKFSCGPMIMSLMRQAAA